MNDKKSLPIASCHIFDFTELVLNCWVVMLWYQTYSKSKDNLHKHSSTPAAPSTARLRSYTRFYFDSVLLCLTVQAENNVRDNHCSRKPKGSSVVEVHGEWYLVYGPTVVIGRSFRKWCYDFKNGRTYVHNENWSGRPSI